MLRGLGLGLRAYRLRLLLRHQTLPLRFVVRAGLCRFPKRQRLVGRRFFFLTGLREMGSVPPLGPASRMCSSMLRDRVETSSGDPSWWACASAGRCMLPLSNARMLPARPVLQKGAGFDPAASGRRWKIPGKNAESRLTDAALFLALSAPMSSASFPRPRGMPSTLSDTRVLVSIRDGDSEASSVGPAPMLGRAKREARAFSELLTSRPPKTPPDAIFSGNASTSCAIPALLARQQLPSVAGSATQSSKKRRVWFTGRRTRFEEEIRVQIPLRSDPNSSKPV
jgi:hypothetical protein